jgi:hypothetical protein
VVAAAAGPEAAANPLTIPAGAAGLSALLNSLAPIGALGPDLAAADLPAAVITRSFAR